MSKLTGRCLCGHVRYECNSEAIMGGHCQCKDCQKISGSGHMSNIAVPRGSITFYGEMAFHEKEADSGNMIRRGFCPKCGSHIYAENSGMQEMEFIRAGSLDDLEQFQPSMVVYSDSGASWDHMPDELPKFGGMPKM
ncbi:putative Isopropylmalate isomerase large subunit [Vibrio nigripulchritudo SO65]|uniref:GFA family protein n=1 Tax=Vibrio nigripulchritudo TaxID=28173 RepID=UPI0003B1E76F|nr:GFA family protein [Vibrio nigripulchritudo]CCN32950.1 putative Isopropylmalate isomerase large subunit [Vibrio nigripulchritudo AM115]CCN44094.1 putative Isopropylmalate isomerase large subunit [Vibrio nigripulchritudo FTn2]CCN64294.1 putative Isopropylmalate isomerase large subunit [Vibrio nigripulchritudo POn4]CCN76052.1 putative Isopropylmalate isomerase large subunit [Vibrio nigripulchritudo SO65]BCL71893.1 aldehyde-activating protein [Vibrio nigripulchritudo]